MTPPEVLADKKRWTVVQADCIDAMKAMPENCVDAIVCDPPYALINTSRKGSPRSNNPNTAASRHRTGAKGGFMNQEWDSPGDGTMEGYQEWCEQWAKEAIRVLKPGGHALVMGGTRTYHRLVCALEDTGFEIRDTISWSHGSGFPKSHNVGLTIDKLKGHPDRGHRIATASRYHPDGTPEPNGENLPPYEGKSAEGKQWQGWGTATKPSHEPVVLCRKPLSEGTVTANVLKWGTGGLNIDASRIVYPHGKPESGWSKSGADGSRGFLGTNTFKLRPVSAGEIQQRVALGRWPPNLLLSHSPSCKRVGTKTVKNRSGSVSGEEPSAPAKNVYGEYDRKPYERHGGESGEEVVEVWECDESCPVRLMDEQSGERAPGARPAIVNAKPLQLYEGGWKPRGRPERITLDGGGASRFFPQFAWDEELDGLPPFFYTAKASRSERERGLTPTKPLVKHGARWRDVENALKQEALNAGNTDGPMAGRGEPGLKCKKCGHWKVSGNPCTCPEPDWEQTSFERPVVLNRHPTVKPVALMRWLCRLVTPPGGVVLDPFCGSGSTGIACVMEGFRFVGVEKEPEYVTIANARITHWERHPFVEPKRPPRTRGDKHTPSLLSFFGEEE